MTHPRRSVRIALLSLCACAAFAQNELNLPTRVQNGSVTFSSSGEAFTGFPVTNAPYSAHQVLEHSQTLADGTHVTQTPLVTLVFRDSQGRTRTERPLLPARQRPMVIRVDDPVAGYEYILDTDNRVAHRIRLQRLHSAGGENDPPPPPPTPVERISPPTAMTWEVGGNKSTQEPLGTQVMEGVTVEGVRLTSIVKVGSQGNDQPITQVQEHWYSPQLGREILGKRFDPRSGETVTRLTDIVLAEPDPALFQVPADFTIVDEKAPFNIHYAVRPQPN